MIFWHYSIILTQVTQCRPLRSTVEPLNQTEKVKTQKKKALLHVHSSHVCLVSHSRQTVNELRMVEWSNWIKVDLTRKVTKHPRHASQHKFGTVKSCVYCQTD